MYRVRLSTEDCPCVSFRRNFLDADYSERKLIKVVSQLKI